MTRAALVLLLTALCAPAVAGEPAAVPPASKETRLSPAMKKWRRAFQKTVRKAWAVPEAATHGTAGGVTFLLVFQAGGALESVEVERMEGPPELAAAALRAVQGAAVALPPPVAAEDAPLTLHYSFFYNLFEHEKRQWKAGVETGKDAAPD